MNNWPVSDGLFTVQLDFGAAAFNGDTRWLEITVNGTLLTPRQRVNATPYAVQTRGIFVSQDGDGTYTITHTADDSFASEALAFAGIDAIAVPSGGIALFGGVVGTVNAEYAFDMSVRGKTPAITS